MKIKVFYICIVDLYIRIIFVLLLITLFYYLNICFTYNTLYTYTTRNFPLTIGVIFSVFLEHDENLQDL